MTQTENENNKKDSRYITKWNALFDKTFSQWISFKPKENALVFPCYSCRDMFGSKNSFLDHTNRRGMLIKYKCPACPQKCPITFYNPCSLLLHTREHYTATSGEVDLENVDISLVPTGLAGFFQHPDIPMLYDVEDDNLGESLTINTKFYAPAADTEGNRVVILKPLMLLFYQLSTPNSQSSRLVLKQLSYNIPTCRFVKYTEDKTLSSSSSSSPSAITNFNIVSDEIIIKDEPIDVDEDYVESTHRIVEKGKAKSVTNNQEQKHEVFTLKSASCPECYTTQRCKMVEHFLGPNKPIDVELTCTECRYIATTQCSLSAHERLHRSEPPFVCPECGKDFPEFSQLIEHLDIVCFHIAKSVRFKCTVKHCKKIFASTETYVDHFTLHMNELVRCKLCQTVVKSERWFKESDPSHSCSENCEHVYKCTACENDLNLYTNETYNQHIRYHCIDNVQRIYVYICKVCRNYFRSRENYALHVVKCLKVKLSDTESSGKVKNPIFPTWKKKQTPSNLKVAYIFKCRYCKSVFSSHVTYNDHLLKCNKRDGGILPKLLPKTDKFIETEISNDAKVNCALCTEKFGIQEIQNHLVVCVAKHKIDERGEVSGEENCINKIKIADVTSAVNLEELKEKLDSVNDIKKLKDNLMKKCSEIEGKTLIQSYGGKPIEVQIINSPPPRIIPQKRKKTIKAHTDVGEEDSFSLKSNSPTSDSSEIKRKRKKSASPKVKKQSLDDPDLELAQEEPIKFNGIYYCRLCDYNQVDRVLFQKHVKEHRDGSTTYQCMDCGECFVVKPSLIKHLNFIHQINDTDKYFKENNCFEVIDVKEFEEPVGENQCSICRLEFTDKFELNKHFRVHGMAFLKKNLK